MRLCSGDYTLQAHAFRSLLFLFQVFLFDYMFDMFCIVFFNDEEIKCIELNWKINRKPFDLKRSRMFPCTPPSGPQALSTPMHPHPGIRGIRLVVAEMEGAKAVRSRVSKCIRWSVAKAQWMPSSSCASVPRDTRPAGGRAPAG